MHNPHAMSRLLQNSGAVGQFQTSADSHVLVLLYDLTSTADERRILLQQSSTSGSFFTAFIVFFLINSSAGHPKKVGRRVIFTLFPSVVTSPTIPRSIMLTESISGSFTFISTSKIRSVETSIRSSHTIHLFPFPFTRQLPGQVCKLQKV